MNRKIIQNLCFSLNKVTLLSKMNMKIAILFDQKQYFMKIKNINP